MDSICLREADKSLSLEWGQKKLTIHKGDLLTLQADAVVCPVDPSLDFRSGLARIVSQTAGKDARHQRPALPEPFGKVIVLPGGKLKAKYIFLTVLLGERGLEKMRLSISQAVDRSIRYAEFLRLKSVAFPVLGSPKEAPPYDFVVKEMLENVTKYFKRRNTKIKAILFSAYNNHAFEAFRKEAKEIADL